MRRLAEFAVHIGFLPRRRWFWRLVLRELWYPSHGRDAGDIDGWVNLGRNISPEMVQNFAVWFDFCSKRPEIAGDSAT